MNAKRTRGWWLTRIELAVAIVAIAIILIAGARLFSYATEPCFGCTPVSAVGVPLVLLALITVPLALVGLAWMVSIFRGTRDEPLPWRYRDR